MPESHAALGRAYEKQIIFPVRISRRMAAHKRRGVKRRGDFCVKNGRLFERSEFLPFSKNFLEVAPEDSALDLFLLVSFLFVSRQKEKYINKLFTLQRNKKTTNSMRLPEKTIAFGR